MHRPACLLPRRRPPLRLPHLLAVGLLACSLPLQAADDRRAEALRERARQAQQAAQAAQAELARLQAERQALDAELAQLRQAQPAAVQRERLAAADAASARRALADAEQALRALQQAHATLQADLARHQAVARQQDTQARAALAEQRQTLQAVLDLLQAHAQALRVAEANNQQLLALGRQAAQAWAQETPVAMRSRHNPLGGLDAVRLEDRAEQLRREMDRLQLSPR